jgi:lysine-ketoglutarate reductase/saccharopine dehydrogenase-like protein (TIGR00300 family)
MSAERSAQMSATGHLIDSGLMSRYLNLIVENGGRYELRQFEVGKTVNDYSTVAFTVSAPSEALDGIVAELVSLGCHIEGDAVVTLKASQADRTVPEDFYSTTNHRSEVRIEPGWIPVENQRMDACLVVDAAAKRARCVKLRDIKKGDLVVCGGTGVRVYPHFKAREAQDFVFMANDVSSERRVERMVVAIANEMREIRGRGGKVVVVAGPVVVHTGGGEHLGRLIRGGFVQTLLAGNALAVHDVEHAILGTSLGVDLKTGIPAHEGHMNHMRAINHINKAGSLRGAVEKGALRSGIFYECVKAGVPYVLAGSIRDDGPLPDVHMNLIEAQEKTAAEIVGAEMALILSTMLHGIGVGNMLPSWVKTVCVDINPAVVTKLADRGSAQAVGIVTDVGLFLRLLADELVPR